MKNLIHQLSQTYIQMLAEAENPATMQAVPSKAKTLGNVNPVTGETESGVHEYDSETGEKLGSYSTGDEFPDADTRTPDERRQQDEEDAESDRRAEAAENRTTTTKNLPTPPGLSDEDRKLAKKFPEAFPDNVVMVNDKEGNSQYPMEVGWKSETTHDYSPEAQQERLRDFISRYNSNMSYDENVKRWNRGISSYKDPSSGEDVEFPSLAEPGDPFDSETKTTNITGFPITESCVLTFKQYLQEKTAAWTRKEGKDPEGGLNKKGVESYRRENPGSKLQTAVTTKPSKLKPGSKKAKRRKSFCKRMKGMKKKLTSAKTARDPDSRINKALRKWNCE